MTDESPEGLRRARRAADDAPDPVVPDDTAADQTSSGRSGGRFEDPVGPATPVPPAHAAFVRPGSSSENPPEPVPPGGRFGGGSETDGEGPAPRRSAASSVTPPDVPSFEAPVGGAPVAAVAAPTGSPATSAEPDPPTDPDADELTTGPTRNPWTTRLVAGALVLALVVGALYLAIRQATRDDITVSVTQSPSGSGTPTGPDAVTDASLLSGAEAGAALGGTAWTIKETLTEVLPSSAQVTCMTNPEGLPNAQITRQRVLEANQDSALAALQRLDSYATEEVAAQAYQVRLAKLSACDDVPALLDSAAQVEGLADESFSVTIAYQDPTVQYRTVVLSRTGTAVSMIDVARNAEAVEPAKVAAAAVASSTRLCATANGTCPATLSVRPEVVPPTPIFGWLAQSDIPRVTAGQGIWSATQVAQVTTKGSQCENLTLASVTGPTGREQRSYLLDQDDAAPEAFGVDQVRMVFADEAAAKTFADKLGNDIASCGTRSETAKISEQRTLSITGQNRNVVTGRIFLVTQATGANTEVYFRVGVVRSDNRVTYLVSNTRKNFDFSTDSWLMLSARAGQRITQSR